MPPKNEQAKRQRAPVFAYGPNNVYWSKTTNDSHSDNLNHQLSVVDPENGETIELECRQLTFLFLLCHDLKQEHNYQSIISKIANGKPIPASILRALAKYDAEHIDKRADTFQHIGMQVNQLGLELNTHATQMKLNETRFFSFRSGNHDMGIVLRKKPSGYVIKFYDPNLSRQHVRGFYKEYAGLSGAMLRHILSPHEIKHYFDATQHGILAQYRNPRQLVERNSSRPITHTTPLSLVTAANLLCFSMYLGSVPATQAALTCLFSPQNDADTIIDLLSSDQGSNGCGLAFAMQEGNLEAVVLFFKQLKQSHLSESQQLTLMHALPYLQTGLIQAVQNNDEAIVSTYLNAVLPYVKHERDLCLLRAGDEALACAFNAGHFATLNTYINTLASCENIGIENTVRTLQQAGLSEMMAQLMQFGQVDLCNKYLQFIMHSRLDTRAKYQLVLQRHHGYTALYLALSQGQTDVIRLYMNHVMSQNAFSPEQKWNLLIAAGPVRMGLESAMQKNHTAAARTYLSGLEAFFENQALTVTEPMLPFITLYLSSQLRYCKQDVRTSIRKMQLHSGRGMVRTAATAAGLLELPTPTELFKRGSTKRPYQRSPGTDVTNKKHTSETDIHPHKYKPY